MVMHVGLEPGDNGLETQLSALGARLAQVDPCLVFRIDRTQWDTRRAPIARLPTVIGRRVLRLRDRGDTELHVVKRCTMKGSNELLVQVALSDRRHRKRRAAIGAV